MVNKSAIDKRVVFIHKKKRKTYFYDDERLVCDYLIYFIYDRDECGFSNIE